MHILRVDCGASPGIIEHLLARGPIRDLGEEVVLVGANRGSGQGQRLLARGFQVGTLAQTSVPLRLTAYSTPLLVFHSPDRKLAYIGGYGSGRFQDEAVWKQLREGIQPAPLPPGGCALR